MASEFGKLLKTLIYQQYDSARAFVRVAKGFSSEDAGVARVSKVMADKLPPPLDRLDAWADALKLEGAARDHFWDLATIAHLPELVRGRFEKIVEEHRKLLADYRDLAALVKRNAKEDGR